MTTRLLRKQFVAAPRMRTSSEVLYCCSFLVVVVAFGSVPCLAAEPKAALRILCYNIHHGEGVDGRIDLQRQAEVILSAKPDIVALQEVDDKTARSGRVNQTEVISQLTGMNGQFVYQLDYDGGRYGQAILSTTPISDLVVHWLPGTTERDRRIAGAVTVEFEGTSVLFITTHLHHNDSGIREQQARKLNELFADAAPERLAIIAGDFNATPESKPMNILEEKWQSAKLAGETFLTYPSSNPECQLDYVLFRSTPRFIVSSASVIPESVASDHRPMLVEIRAVNQQHER